MIALDGKLYDFLTTFSERRTHLKTVFLIDFFLFLSLVISCRRTTLFLKLIAHSVHRGFNWLKSIDFVYFLYLTEFLFCMIENKLPLKVDSLSLSPHPLRLRKGQSVTLGGKFRVGAKAGRKYKVDATVWKKVPVMGWFEVPCFGMW